MLCSLKLGFGVSRSVFHSHQNVLQFVQNILNLWRVIVAIPYSCMTEKKIIQGLKRFCISAPYEALWLHNLCHFPYNPVTSLLTLNDKKNHVSTWWLKGFLFPSATKTHLFLPCDLAPTINHFGLFNLELHRKMPSKLKTEYSS